MIRKESEEHENKCERTVCIDSLGWYWYGAFGEFDLNERNVVKRSKCGHRQSKCREQVTEVVLLMVVGEESIFTGT